MSLEIGIQGCSIYVLNNDLIFFLVDADLF